MTRQFRHRAGLLAAWLAVGALGAGCDINVGDGGFNIGLATSKAVDTWTRTYTVADGGSFEVVNGNGAIEASQGTGPTVEVRAERTAKASTDEAAKALLAKIEIVETVKADSVRLETKAPKTFGTGGAEVKYVIKIPPGLSLRARTSNGHITLTALANHVEASTTNGSVRGDGLAGAVTAETTNGGITLTVVKLDAGGLRAETTNGGVTVELPSDAKADVSAHVTNGSIGLDNLKLEAVGDQSRRHVEGTLNGGGARVELSTTNGGIHLAGK